MRRSILFMYAALFVTTSPYWASAQMIEHNGFTMTQFECGETARAVLITDNFDHHTFTYVPSNSDFIKVAGMIRMEAEFSCKTANSVIIHAMHRFKTRRDKQRGNDYTRHNAYIPFWQMKKNKNWTLEVHRPLKTLSGTLNTMAPYEIREYVYGVGKSVGVQHDENGNVKFIENPITTLGWSKERLKEVYKQYLKTEGNGDPIIAIKALADYLLLQRAEHEKEFFRTKTPLEYIRRIASRANNGQFEEVTPWDLGTAYRAKNIPDWTRVAARWIEFGKRSYYRLLYRKAITRYYDEIAVALERASTQHEVHVIYSQLVGAKYVSDWMDMRALSSLYPEMYRGFEFFMRPVFSALDSKSTRIREAKARKFREWIAEQRRKNPGGGASGADTYQPYYCSGPQLWWSPTAHMC